MWWMKFMLMEKAGDPPAGGGNPPPDHAKDIAELKKAKEELKALVEKLAKPAAPPPEDPGLAEKARKEREAKEKLAGDSKALEAALKFSLGAKEWAKTNASLLPKDIEGIFAHAEKETYDNAIEKDRAVKSAVTKLFFEQQANLDLLTPTQKTTLEDWLKLTNTGRHEKAQGIFDSIFEPTFEMLKRIKKAEQLNRTGHVEQGDTEKAYKERLVKGSRKHYLNEAEKN